MGGTVEGQPGIGVGLLGREVGRYLLSPAGNPTPHAPRNPSI